AACKGNDHLRREVQSLIASYEQAGTFIDSPAFQASAEIRTAETKELQAGQMLGAYTIISLLGAGGMGEVYLAHDTRLSRKVALKVFPAALVNNSERLHRVKLEAQTASGLNHPNIITIHENGAEGGTHFIATEFIDGETLRRK